MRVSVPVSASEKLYRALRWVSWSMVVAGAGLLCATSRGFVTGLIFVPFALGPMIFSVVLAHRVRGRASQFTLFASAVLYFAWFLTAVILAFYVHPDPQSAIVLLFIGVYSLPVIVLFWCAAWWTRERPAAVPPPLPSSDVSDKSDPAD